MKLRVLKPFRDKVAHVTRYPGSEFSVEKERGEYLISRELVEDISSKPKVDPKPAKAGKGAKNEG